MNDDYRQALLGTFLPPSHMPAINVTLVNSLPIDVRASFVTADGWLAGFAPDGGVAPGYPGLVLAAGQQLPPLTYVNPTWLVITDAHTGGFIGLAQVLGGTFSITRDLLVAPGDAGPIPEPGRHDRLIPVDSQRVVVGAGTVNGKRVVREQCWRRTADSFSLAPHETRSISRTISSGMERTSTESHTVAASLGLDVSAGWGPVSASVSASISRSSTTTQSVTFTSHQTTFVAETVTNDNDYPVMYLLWQLTDIVTVCDASGMPEASMVTVGQPVVIRGPYQLDTSGRLAAMAPLEPQSPR